MLKKVLFVQLYFAITIHYLFAIKFVIFPENLLCSGHRTGSAQQVRCLFSISFYRRLKAHSSMFYLQHVTQILLTVQNVTSPHRFYYHSHPFTQFFWLIISHNSFCSHILTLLPAESWLLGIKGNTTKLKTGDKFLPERGRSHRAAVVSCAMGEAWVSQTEEENEETSLAFYAPLLPFDNSSCDYYLVWHLLTSAYALCASQLLQQGVPHLCSLRETHGASQAPQSRQLYCTSTIT